MGYPLHRTMRVMGGHTNNPLAVLATLLAVAVYGEAFSTVIPERLPIYSRPSASATVVKSLERGQNVAIDVMISRAGSDWCLIREPGLKDATGYCLCSQLAGKPPPANQIRSVSAAGAAPGSS